MFLRVSVCILYDVLLDDIEISNYRQSHGKDIAKKIEISYELSNSWGNSV